MSYDKNDALEDRPAIDEFGRRRVDVKWLDRFQDPPEPRECACGLVEGCEECRGDREDKVLTMIVLAWENEVKKRTMMTKRMLYEFTQYLQCNVVVAAENEQQAREAIKTWERAWIETGDFICCIDDTPELVDEREPSSQDRETLEDEAHEIV